MLTDEEKKRIKEEELFRNEVKQELQAKAKKPPWERRWEYFNSSLFIWFLSTIVLGTATFLYARWDKSREEERRNQEQLQLAKHEKEAAIKKLDMEISNRLNLVNVTLSPYYYSWNEVRISDIFVLLDTPEKAKEPSSVFQEYASRNFQSLLWELLQLVPENEKKEIESALDASRQLFPIAATAVKDITTPIPVFNYIEDESEVRLFIAYQAGVERAKKDLNLKAFNLDRWGKPIIFYPIDPYYRTRKPGVIYPTLSPGGIRITDKAHTSRR